MTDFREKAPQPGPPRPYHFPPVVRKTLSNGLRIVAAESHAAPLVAVRALVRSGANHDTAQTAGLASLTAELLDEGAAGRDAIRLAEDLGRLGASLGTGADWDASYLSIDVLARNAAAAIEIFSDVVRRPKLPEASLERIRSERLNELIQQRDEASAVAGKRFSNLLYGGGTYGNSVVGNPESVERITSRDVRTFYDAHYVANNTTIVVTGDIDAGAMVALIERLFGDWERKPEPTPPSIKPASLDSSKVYLIDRPTAVQSEIRVGHLGVPRSCEDYFPLTVMNALLGGVFNSRINLNLRERHGYTYGARSAFAFRRQAGPFVVSAPVRNEVTLEAVNEMLAELRRIRTGDVEPHELNDTKAYLAGVFPATVQTASDIAGRLLDMDLYDLPHDYFDRYRENITAVGKDGIERVAKKYIDPDRVLIVIVGNVKQIQEPIGTLGYPIHHLDIDGNALPVA
jgi:predicted Zn-dependent peptidase